MRKINNFKDFLINESLEVSDDVLQVISFLSDEGDKTASFLKSLIASDSYSEDEDLNYIDLSKEINKFSFVPKKRRSDKKEFDRDSMPTRIGKLVNKIYSKAKDFFKVKKKAEFLLEKNEWVKWYSLITHEKLKITLPRFDGAFRSQKFEVEVKIHGIYNEDGLQKLDEKETFKGVLYDYVKLWDGDMKWFTEKGDDSWTESLRLMLSDEQAIAVEKYLDKHLSCTVEFDTTVVLNDKDIEDFVNKVVSFLKVNRADDSAVLEEVKGEDIAFWYDQKNYLSIRGELGNSCMRFERCQSYFGIYTDNPDSVSLIILKNKENKLMGRALLWKLDYGGYLLDRCYTILNSDAYIFHRWAREKGYYYVSNYRIMKDGKQKDKLLSVSLDVVHFDEYPYLDTLKYLNKTTYKLSNNESGGYDIVLNDEYGEYWGRYSDDDDY